MICINLLRNNEKRIANNKKGAVRLLNENKQHKKADLRDYFLRRNLTGMPRLSLNLCVQAILSLQLPHYLVNTVIEQWAFYKRKTIEECQPILSSKAVQDKTCNCSVHQGETAEM